jgi:hypothetical protein
MTRALRFREHPAVHALVSRPRALLWLAFAAFVVVRFPFLFASPSFYAEEGNVYFRYACEHDAWTTLTARHLGYYAFFPNFVTWLASLVPLGLAPWVGLVFGFVGPGICALIIIEAGEDDVPQSAKPLALALIVFTLTMRAEWYATIHTQFWLSVALLLSLAIRPTTFALRRFESALVLVASATGVVSVVLAPVFLAAGVQRRDKRLGALGIVFGIGALLHVVAGAGRSPSWSIAQYVVVLAEKLVAFPLIGKLADPVAQSLYAGAASPAVYIGAAAVLVAWAALALALSRPRWRWVVVGALWAGAVSIYFALPPYEGLSTAYGGTRYSLAGVVPVLVALCVGRRDAHVRLRRVADVVIVLALASGVVSGVALARDHLIEHSSFASDAARFADDAGVTLGLHVPRCRVSVNASRQREGFAVDAPVAMSDGGVRFLMRTGRYDARAPVGVFVLAASDGDVPRLVLGEGGWVAQDIGYYGDGTFVTPGLCYGGVGRPTVVPRESFRGRSHVVALSAATLDALPPSAATVYVGYGRDFADALAKGTFRRYARVELANARALGDQ